MENPNTKQFLENLRVLFNSFFSTTTTDDMSHSRYVVNQTPRQSPIKYTAPPTTNYTSPTAHNHNSAVQRTDAIRASPAARASPARASPARASPDDEVYQDETLFFERNRIKQLKDERIQIQKKTFTKWCNSYLNRVWLVGLGILVGLSP